jgi:predicted O-methyltransferase YrrM
MFSRRSVSRHSLGASFINSKRESTVQVLDRTWKLPPAPEAAYSQPLSGEQIAAWFAAGTFTSDWTSRNFPTWIEVLRPWRQQPVNIVEIGSWEGRSALFFLNYIRCSRIVCIDPFTGNAIHRNNPAMAAHLLELETIFDANVASFADRIEKIAAPSSTALPQLAVSGRRFDIAYVDGCHLASDVFSDAALLWPMIVASGIVIFDDYTLAIDPNVEQRPKVGIDRFLELFAGQYTIVRSGAQMIVRKK